MGNHGERSRSRCSGAGLRLASAVGDAVAHVYTVPMATDLARGAPLTEDDLATMPDDGHRYELIDGVLIVSPAPTRTTREALKSLVTLLHAPFDADHELVLGPSEVRFSRPTVLIPDLLVTRKGYLSPARLETAPLLVVEVRSPSTRLFDIGAKRMVHEAAGALAYWLVDADGPAASGGEAYTPPSRSPSRSSPHTARRLITRAAGGAGGHRGGAGGRRRRCRRGRRWPGCRRPGW